jgi:hypothetical protein
MKHLIAALALICFSGVAQAKTFNQKTADAMGCTSRWLQEAKGVPFTTSINLQFLSSTSVGGPELPIAIEYISKCLKVRKHDKIGNTRQMQSYESVTMAELINGFVIIIK